MQIKILDSWLRDYLKTSATPQEIAEKLSLSSVSVERLEKYKNDYLYDIEVTTNRPDLMSVLGLAREAATVLNHCSIKAQFLPLKTDYSENNKLPSLIEIKNNPKLVNRICAAVLEVKVEPSPKYLQERLESSDIRSLNNLIDITNYVMRTVGHPAHVFDFDRLNTNTLTIKEAVRGEKIKTLDLKDYLLFGGEIVAIDKSGRIVDLLGIMGLENSVVTENTKRILYFIDNNEKSHIRKASMSLGIRTEAAVLNEKNLDSELAKEALLYGIDLFEKLANGKVISSILDIYPNKPGEKKVQVSQDKINSVIGIEIPIVKSSKILNDLGFENKIIGNKLNVNIPSFRKGDVEEEVDIIEEIARIYGFGNLPNKLINFDSNIQENQTINDFYWEKRVKDALKYWGFTEIYSYSMVSEEMLEGPIEEAVQIQNPLSEEFVYMRQTLIPSLLKVISENKKSEQVKIFELSNIYLKTNNGLPEEILTLSGVIKKNDASFYEVKGLLEQLLFDLGIKKIIFKNSQKTGLGASLYLDKEYLGEIEVLDKNLIDFEINFAVILKYANVKKEYKKISKFPPIIEDVSIVVSDNIRTDDIVEEIKIHSQLITDVFLKDRYKDTRTFRIIYQDNEKNLTVKDVTLIREQIISTLKNKFLATIK